MKKKFVANLALLLLLNLLIKPFWVIGIDRGIQESVGAEAYGFYFSLLNFTFLFNIMLDVGLNNFNNRNIAQNQQLLSKHFSNLVVFKFYLAILYFVLCMLIAIALGYEWKQIKLLLVLVFNQFMLSFILYLRSNLSGLQLFKTDSIISVLDRFLLISICSVLLWGNITEVKFKIEWLVYAQTVSYFVTALVSMLVLLPKMRHVKLRADRKFYLAILKKSLPFALLILLQSFYYRVDSVMLERMMVYGKEQAGIYAQAFRLLDAFSMFSYLFASLLLPMFSRMLKEKHNINELLKLSYSLILVPTMLITISGFYYSTEIMTLFYKSHISTSSQIYLYLMIGFLGVSTSYIFGTLLTANGNLRELNYMAGVGMVLNISLNFTLIQKYNAVGAAVASMITQLVTAAVQIIIVYRVFKMKFDFKYVIVLVGYLMLLIILGCVCKSFFPDWKSGILSFFIIGGGIFVILKPGIIKKAYISLRNRGMGSAC